GLEDVQVAVLDHGELAPAALVRGDVVLLQPVAAGELEEVLAGIGRVVDPVVVHPRRGGKRRVELGLGSGGSCGEEGKEEDVHSGIQTGGGAGCCSYSAPSIPFFRSSSTGCAPSHT